MEKVEIIRSPLYFKSDVSNLFGWIHHTGHSSYNTAAIICSPVGKESNHTHRTVRHTADSLALAGVPTLRFDYFSTGDSNGTEFDQNIVEHWLTDIRSASQFLKTQTNCKKIIIVGIRIGATLAASLSSELDFELIVLWYPVYRGKRFFRELEITAHTSIDGLDKSLPYFESAGFLMTKETENEIKALNILTENIKVQKKVLLLEHDENNDSEKFRSKLNAENILFDHLYVDGMEEMFTLPHLNQVPFETIEIIQSWVKNNLEFSGEVKISLDLIDSQILTFKYPDDYFEKALIFNEEKKLFGIYTKSKKKNFKPVVLILNTGADHHIGSNRLSVFLSRQLGEIGYDTFRIDLSGLGDSIVTDINLENVLFKKSTGDDIKTAVDFLQNNFENRSVVLFGVCAGGQAVYLSGIDQPNLPIVDYIIMNCIMYRWKDNRFTMFLNHLHRMDYIQNSAPDFRKFFQLISGKNKLKNILTLIRSGFTIIKNKINIGFLFPGIQADLNHYLQNKIPMTLIFSDYEYGYGLIEKYSRTAFKKLIKYKFLNIYFIKGANHVLSHYSSRLTLAEVLKSHLEKQFRSSDDGIS